MPKRTKSSSRQPKGASKEEVEILKKESNHTLAEQEELEERRRLEGPHQEEPNQEGKGEFGDFSPGLADLAINQIAVEQADIVTDPLLNGWQDSEHREAIDECRSTFGATIKGNQGGSITADKETQAGNLFNTVIGSGEASSDYYVNNVFSTASHRCVGGTTMVPRFTAPNPVNVGESVGFDGMESTVGLIEGLGFDSGRVADKDLRHLHLELRGRLGNQRLRARLARLRSSMAQPLRRQRVPRLCVRRDV